MGEPKHNINKAVEIIKEIQQKSKADVIVFPELALNGYLLENLVREAAITKDDPVLDPIKELSQKTEIIMGMVLRIHSRLYNATVVFYENEIKHIQKKIYLPTYGMFDEARYLRRGSKLGVWQGRLGTSGILICEDAWHPVLPYALFQQGARHVFVVSASPNRGFEESSETEFASQLMWKKRLQVYAESYGMFFYYINRSGVEDGVYYGGQNFVVSAVGTHQDFESWDSWSLAKVHKDELSSATYLGGPFQEENFQLNMKILNESYESQYR